MKINKSKIVEIPVKMEKFYGKGTMLHPSKEAIEALVKTIPRGKIATIETLCQKLAATYGTDVTCPMRTGNSIKKISENYAIDTVDESLPFWRVVKKDKTVIKLKGYELWAAKIEDEGFGLSYTKAGLIKVNFDEKALFMF